MPKKPIIIISVLCIIALALGYWTGQGKREGDSNSAASSKIDEGINSGREPKSEKVKEPNFLKAGLVAFYPLDGHGNDLSGNVNHCKMHDVKEASDRFGKQGGSLFFNGKSSYLESSNAFNLGSEEITISLWVYPTRRQDTFSVSLVRCDPWSFYMQQPNNIHGWCHGVSGATPTGSVADKKWTQVAYRFRRNQLDLFINGRVASSAKGGTINKTQPRFINIGGHWANSRVEESFAGYLDDIRVFNRALSDREIYQLYDLHKIQTIRVP